VGGHSSKEVCGSVKWTWILRTVILQYGDATDADPTDPDPPPPPPPPEIFIPDGTYRGIVEGRGSFSFASQLVAFELRPNLATHEVPSLASTLYLVTLRGRRDESRHTRAGAGNIHVVQHRDVTLRAGGS
jgi:hypothetical protein